MRAFDWYAADSADDQHDDLEVSLVDAAEGVWAHVTDEGDSWSWAVLDHWLWDSADYLASGSESTQAEAKAAVEAWVNQWTSS